MPDVLDDLLSLLAATILADKRIFSEEIRAFGQAANQLAWIKQNHPGMSEARLLEWYEFNKDALDQKIHSPYFKTWFYDCLDRLAGIEDKNSILNAISLISHSDGEVHVSERALMALAAPVLGY